MQLAELIEAADTKIVLVVMDGLGGYADADHGTELEEAATPNLDALAAEGSTGLVEPVGPGITPGSGPGHLGLFGYDPEEYELGRGALSAAGLEFELEAGDVAARGNFATLGADGTITDRRAGRIADDDARVAVDSLEKSVRVRGVEVFFRHEREHRLLVVLRGDGLDLRLTDTDPQRTGVPPATPEPLVPDAKHTADLVAELDAQIRTALSGQPKANVVLLRGFDTHRELPSFATRYGLRAAAVAIYPMYRGIARLLGMDVLGRPATLDEQLAILRDAWDDYDYFFVHHKATDSAVYAYEHPAIEAQLVALDTVVEPAARGRLLREIGDHKFQAFADMPLFWLYAEAGVHHLYLSMRAWTTEFSRFMELMGRFADAVKLTAG